MLRSVLRLGLKSHSLMTAFALLRWAGKPWLSMALPAGTGILPALFLPAPSSLWPAANPDAPDARSPACAMRLPDFAQHKASAHAVRSRVSEHLSKSSLA